VHAGKLGQVTDFTIVGGTASAKHCIDHCLLGGSTAMPGRLHGRLCHSFLVNNLLLLLLLLYNMWS